MLRAGYWFDILFSLYLIVWPLQIIYFGSAPFTTQLLIATTSLTVSFYFWRVGTVMSQTDRSRLGEIHNGIATSEYPRTVTARADGTQDSDEKMEVTIEGPDGLMHMLVHPAAADLIQKAGSDYPPLTEGALGVQTILKELGLMQSVFNNNLGLLFWALENIHDPQLQLTMDEHNKIIYHCLLRLSHLNDSWISMDRSVHGIGLKDFLKFLLVRLFVLENRLGLPSERAQNIQTGFDRPLLQANCEYHKFSLPEWSHPNKSSRVS